MEFTLSFCSTGKKKNHKMQKNKSCYKSCNKCKNNVTQFTLKKTDPDKNGTKIRKV